MFGCIIIHAPAVFFPACEQWQGRNPPCGRAWCQILLGDTLLVASRAARGTNTAAWTQGALEMLLKLKKKRIERTIQNSSKNKTSWRSYAEIHWDHKLSKFFHAVHHCQDTRPSTIIQHSTGSTVKHAGNNPSQLLQKLMNNDSYIHFSTESFKCFHLRCILTASGFEIWHWIIFTDSTKQQQIVIRLIGPSPNHSSRPRPSAQTRSVLKQLTSDSQGEVKT